MSGAEILQEARQRGIVLEAQGGELRYRAPKGSLTSDLRSALAEHKREIIAALVEGKRTRFGLCPGPDKCGGCYSVGVIDGRERFLHPPKPAMRWLQ